MPKQLGVRIGFLMRGGYRLDLDPSVLTFSDDLSDDAAMEQYRNEVADRVGQAARAGDSISGPDWTNNGDSIIVLAAHVMVVRVAYGLLEADSPADQDDGDGDNPTFPADPQPDADLTLPGAGPDRTGSAFATA